MRISVFIPSYNQRDYLVEAVESVLAQTLPPAQVIIVDDGSTDGSQDVIAGYAARYPELITAIYHRENLGVARVRRHALEAVTGEYVTYVDGDDWFLPEKLEKEAQALLENPWARIAFSNNVYISEDDPGERRWIDDEMPPQGDIFLRTFARDFPKRSLFRMELVEYQSWRDVGFHDPRLVLYEDFDMRIRLTKQCRAVYVDEVLSAIRVHRTGLSSRPASDHLAALKYIYYKNLPLVDDLDAACRRELRQKFALTVAGSAQRAIEQALEAGHYRPAARVRALRQYVDYTREWGGHLGHRTLAQIILPRSAHGALRAVRGIFKGSQ